MTAAATEWSKPAFERHAHLSEALARKLSKAPKAAIELGHYLFRVCIDGKFEEIELYNLPLGDERETPKRQGRRYARNTLREALKVLARFGLVIIRKSYGCGVFSLTVCHPGEKRPFPQFVRNSPRSSKNCSPDPKTDQVQPSNDAPPSPITEEFILKAEHDAAALKNSFVAEEEEVAKAVPVVSEILSATGKEEYAPVTEIEVLEPEANECERQSDRIINTQSHEICAAIRFVMPLNPQIKAEALNYTLAQVQAALALYQERKQKKPISNPCGWLTDCLRGKWAMSGNRDYTTQTAPRYPAELVEWYEKATLAGIVDGRPLQHCPMASATGNLEHLQVVVKVPPQERLRNDIVPYRFVLWREAMALYPLTDDLTAGQTASVTESPTVPATPSVPPPQSASESEEFQTVEIPEGYQPDPEIQRLIEESLGGTSEPDPDQDLEPD